MNKIKTIGDFNMRWFATFDFDETTRINGFSYEEVEQKSHEIMRNHFAKTGERTKAYIFQDKVQIMTINFEN